MKSVISALKQKVDVKYRDGSRKYFKGTMKNYGVRLGDIRKIAREHFDKTWTKEETFKHCDALLATGYHEPLIVAFAWVYKQKEHLVAKDFLRFERWLKKYVHNWAACDDFGNHVMTELLFAHPEVLPKLLPWTKSKNRWVRRAAAVSLVVAGRKGKYHKEIFKIADALLTDEDDMVQKGYGWMLKEASNADQQAVFRYVMKKKGAMPRTALRYAIEKMPQSLRKQAMA